MQHIIPVDQLGPQGPAMANAMEKCVHCGFCLSTCPTYVVLGEEMDSPRGRITLMKGGAGRHAAHRADTCPTLTAAWAAWRACTACPSGVPYGELLTPYRARAEAQRTPRAGRRSWRATLARETLPYPGRFRLAAATGRLARPLKRLLPAKLGAMVDAAAGAAAALGAAARRSIPAQGPRARAGGAAGRLRAAGAGARDQLGHRCACWRATGWRW